MADSAVQIPSDPSIAEMNLPAKTQPSLSRLGKDLLKPLASLRLTVVLFALATVLIFCGTLAQIDAGIWTVVRTYFRSAYVWIPFQIFFPRSMGIPGAFLFPGGWLIGGLLLLNLVTAHAVRFKATWKRSGIILLHLGIIVMFVGEAVTGLYAVEGNMTIVEGSAANYVENNLATELAIVDASDAEYDDVVVIPESILRSGDLVTNELLPFDVEVEHYMVHSTFPRKPESQDKNPATAGMGINYVTEEQPEVSGVDPEQVDDMASAYVTFRKKGTDESLGTYLVSSHFSRRQIQPQPVSVEGRSYLVDLRLKRTYKPYTLHLIDFKHEKYIGTETPKNFESVVRLVDPERNEDREVRIYMNHPLQHAGETFYQSSFLVGDAGTVLQVVRNPGWIMPYLSCAMVSGGMLMHFGMNLFVFLRRRK